MLREVEESECSTRLEDAHGFLEGESRVGRVVQNLAHKHEVGIVVGEARLYHVGDFRGYVLDALLLENLLEPADDLRVVVERGHVLAAVREHQRKIAAFAAADVHGVFEGDHELAEQADLRLEAAARLVQFVDLPLGLVGAFFEHLFRTAADNVLVA